MIRRLGVGEIKRDQARSSDIKRDQVSSTEIHVLLSELQELMSYDVLVMQRVTVDGFGEICDFRAPV